jgi:DNA-binding transcriptional LysR family regulator
MTTFQELEAFVASADMGSFNGAARTLKVSKSAISRLIQELEGRSSRPLFNRGRRSAELTAHGEEALRIARVILQQRDVVIERLCDARLVHTSLRFGATELAAMTWLPEFVRRLREQYLGVRIDIAVNASTVLAEGVRQGKLDFAFVVDVVRTKEMLRVEMGRARMGWFCSRESAPEGLSWAELEQHTLLVQGPSTGAGRCLQLWLRDHSIQPGNVIQTESLVALAGMACSGLGIASLPRATAEEGLGSGRLKEVQLPARQPDLGFMAIVRIDKVTDLLRSAIQLARDGCDFDRPHRLSSH